MSSTLVNSAANSHAGMEGTDPSKRFIDEVVDWLKRKGFDQDVCDKFTKLSTAGDILSRLEEEGLGSEIEISALGNRIRTVNAIPELQHLPSISQSPVTRTPAASPARTSSPPAVSASASVPGMNSGNGTSVVPPMLEPERHDVEDAADQQPEQDAQQHDQEFAINEEKPLEHQLDHLVGSMPSAFDCGICFETHAIDYVVSIDACEHQFCRECMRDYITATLIDRRFPILCPVCATGKGRKPSVIPHLLAQDVGISESEDIIWHELEVSGFSLMITCRRCRRSVSVDREDYDEADMITCPLPNCNSTWCKHCQQISRTGSTHSCDGTLEFQYLVEREKMKKCPGCQVVIQKTGGCFHMACKAPGCNTHFCYRCGEFIVRSVVPSEIDRVVDSHYKECGSVFDNPY